MASSYYGDRSNAAFYLKGPSQKQTGQNGRADKNKNQSRSDHGLLTPTPISVTNHHRAHAAAKTVLKKFSDNTKRTNEKFKIEGKEGKGSKSTGKTLKRILVGGPRNMTASWHIPKKLRTIPQPTVNLDSKIPMYLLLVEGSFSHGANRQDYLSNVYYRGETALLPSIGRALDVLPPTKMAAGPWLVMPSKESSATLDDQSDWSGQRIRFTSPKAATTKSLHNFRVSPTTDILGSLTVAAFSGFSTSEEFQNEAQELAQKILRLNKQQDWSKSVAHLPPFRLDGNQPHCCAGGFSIAVDYDPERCTKYYLKIGICEAAQEIVCVDLVFPVRPQEIPSSASTIGAKLTERNLKRHESSYPEPASDQKRNKCAITKTKHAPVEDCVKTFTISSPPSRFHAPSTAFRSSLVGDNDSRTSEDTRYEDAIDFDSPVNKPTATNAPTSKILKDPATSLCPARLPGGTARNFFRKPKGTGVPVPRPTETSPAASHRFSVRSSHDDRSDLTEDNFFDVQSHQSEETGQGNRASAGWPLKTLLIFCVVLPCAVFAHCQLAAGAGLSLSSTPRNSSSVDSALPFPELFYNSATCHALDRSSAELDLGMEIEAQLDVGYNGMFWNCRVKPKHGQLLTGFPRRSDTCPLRQTKDKAATCLQGDGVPTTSTAHEVAHDRKPFPRFRARAVLFVTAGVLHGTFGSTGFHEAATHRAVWVLDRLFLAVTCLRATFQQGSPGRRIVAS